MPSSSGSIISREIASFLNNDKNRFLHGFANFAQALSIWLAPIAPSYYDEDDWFNALDEVSNFTSSKLASFEKKFVKMIWAFFSVSGIGNIQDEKDMIKVYESYVECGKITC